MVVGIYKYFTVPSAFTHWYLFKLDSKKEAFISPLPFSFSKFIISIMLHEFVSQFVMIHHQHGFVL